MPRAQEEPRKWVPAGPRDPTAPSRHPSLGSPSRTWTYYDGDGNILGHVSRFDPPGQRKVYIPQTFDGKRWAWEGWNGIRPLYGLDRLADMPKSFVVVTEGEKAADAAASMLPGCPSVSASGGKASLKHADWSVLRGRPGVILWPDNDHNQGGQNAFVDLAAHLASLGIPVIRIIDPQGQEDGWDAADAGFSPAQLKAWAANRTSTYAGPAVSPWAQKDAPRPTPRPARHVGEEPVTPGTDPYDILGKPFIPSLKPEYLPRAIREFVFDQSEIVGADPGICAIAALVAIAGCANDNIVLQAQEHNESWTEQARLWGAWVADPSSRKTPASMRAIKPLHKIDTDWRAASAIAMKKYKLDQAIYKDAENKYIKAKSKQLMEGGSVSSLPDAPPAPKDKRLIAEDITIEKLGVLSQDNPRGLILPFDELSSWFGSMDAYTSGGTGGKDRSKYLAFWNGGRLVIDRMGRDPLDVPNWSGCIMGGIQPSSIKSIAHRLPEDGLLQRFLIVMAQDVERGQDRAESKEAKSRYTAMLEVLANDNGPPRRIYMSREALEAASRLETELIEIRKLGTASERVKAALGKYTGMFIRLCLTFHLADAADRNTAPPTHVSGDTAWAVFDFMTTYLVGHLVAFYDDLLADNGHCDIARTIGRMILAQEWRSVENRDIHRYHSAWGGYPEWKKAAVMRYLEDAGWLIPIVPDKASRRTVRWDVNERVFELFHMTAAEEQERKIQQIEQRRSLSIARAMQRTVTR